MDNIFESASRNKLRYPSNRGALSIEQLWDLPLTSKAGFDLDSVAKEINADLKNASEESFVASPASNPVRAQLALQLEVVKAVIAFKIAENEKRRASVQKANDKQFLLDLLDKKRTDQMGALSIEEINARLAALDAA